MSSKLCPFCMRMAETDTCPHCGKNINYAGSPAHLPAGYVVSGTHPYVLGAALGQGGFGITYIALDMVTGERVAIKEYYPTYCSTRTNNATVTAYSNQEEVYLKGKEHFLDEARTLKSLSDLKNIVNVLDFFEFNNTAYLVMEYLEGSSLKEYAAKNGKFPAQEFFAQIRPLMEDIERMHQRGVVHRDIAPDNIMLLPDGQMKLIDFGTARSFIGDRSMTVVVKKGFAPLEQYLTKGTTPSTDVYALAATIYYCITGTVPMDSAERQYDGTPLESPAALGADITPLQEKALAKALEIQQKARTQSVQEFLDDLNKVPEEPKPEPVKPESSIMKPSSEEQKSDQVNTLPVEEEAAPVYTAPVKQEEPARTIPMEQHALKSESKPRKKKSVWIAAVAAILAVVLLVGFFSNILTEAAMMRAEELYSDEEYEKAAAVLQRLPESSNVFDLQEKIYYDWAKKLIESKDYDTALEKLGAAPLTDRVHILETEIYYQKALAAWEAGSYEESYQYFAHAPYQSSSEQKALMVLEWAEKAVEFNSTYMANNFAETVKLTEKESGLIFEMLTSKKLYNFDEPTTEVNAAVYMTILRILKDNQPNKSDIEELFMSLENIEEFFRNNQDLIGRIWDYPLTQNILINTYARYGFMDGTWKAKEWQRITISCIDGIGYTGIPTVQGAKDEIYFALRIHDETSWNFIWHNETGTTETKVYRITPLGPNTIDVYSYKDGKTYIMTRE